MQALFSALPDAVVAFDTTGRIHTTNAIAEQLFGYPVGGLVGVRVRELVPSVSWTPDRWPAGKIQRVEGVRRDGSRFPAEVTVGEVDGTYIGVVRDTTRVRELQREVLAAADAVRQHISEEMHDDVGQRLTGLELMVDALSRHATVSADPAVGAIVSHVARGLREVHSATRRLVREGVPTEVDSDGLLAELDRLATRVREWYGRDCTLVAPDPVALLSTTATELYRIVQEAVSNSLRHGKAKSIHIAVRSDDTGIGIEVRDDGEGFADHASGGGFGTRLMRIRAARIGGALAITTTDGGTVVTISLPNA